MIKEYITQNRVWYIRKKDNPVNKRNTYYGEIVAISQKMTTAKKEF